MAEKADDLYLPNAVLLRIIRESLPERTIISREARSAISKSVSSFILYVTSLASSHCELAKRKTLTANDILTALKEMQFDHFIPTLNTFLEKYREQIAHKKSGKHGLLNDSENVIANKRNLTTTTIIGDSTQSTSSSSNLINVTDNEDEDDEDEDPDEDEPVDEVDDDDNNEEEDDDDDDDEVVVEEDRDEIEERELNDLEEIEFNKKQINESTNKSTEIKTNFTNIIHKKHHLANILNSNHDNHIYNEHHQQQQSNIHNHKDDDDDDDAANDSPQNHEISEEIINI